MPAPAQVWTPRVSIEEKAFQIHREPETRVITVATCGLWTVPIVEAYFEVLGEVASQDCAEGLSLRVLIDKRGAPVHPQDTMCRIQAMFTTFYRSGDRVAAIVDTSLVKIQFRRTYSGDICQPFLSPSAARDWLSA